MLQIELKPINSSEAENTSVIIIHNVIIKWMQEIVNSLFINKIVVSLHRN